MIEGNAVLEEAGQRLAALKRRQAMELQHVLTFELRRLAKEARKQLCSTHRDQMGDDRHYYCDALVGLSEQIDAWSA